MFLPLQYKLFIQYLSEYYCNRCEELEKQKYN